MIIREATIHDAAQVLLDLSEISRVDIAAHGLAPDELAGKIKAMIDEGAAHVIVEDGRPIFVCGLTVFGEQWVCWSFASEPFWTARPSLWRILRRYSQHVLAAVNEEVHAYSASPHEKLARWFRAIGFREADPVPPYRHFIYPA